MEESVVSDMANGDLRPGHEISPELVQPLGCEGQQALVAEDGSGLRLVVQSNTALDVLPGRQAQKDEVNGDVTLVSPPTSSVAPALTAIGVTPGETVNGFQLPKDEVNGVVTCVSPPTSSIPPAPTTVGVTSGEVVKKKRGRPFKVFKKKVNGAMPLKPSPPSTTAPTPIGTKMPSGETVKRKRGTPGKKGINGAMPLLSSCTVQASIGVDMATGKLLKRKPRRPFKMRDNGVIPIVSSPSNIAAALGTDMVSGQASNGIDMATGKLLKRKPGRPSKKRDNGVIPIVSSPSTIPAPLGTEMPSGEPMKRKRGRPWNRGINGAMPTVSSPSTALPSNTTEPVKRKGGRPWKRRSIGAMSKESSPANSATPIAMGMPSSPSTAPAMIATEMPSREPVRRKAGRPPKRVIVGAVSLKPSPTSSKALAPIRSMGRARTPRTGTMQQSTSHATPERCVGQLPGDGRKQEMARVGVSEPSNNDRTGAQPQTSLLENVSDIDLRQSLSLAATAMESLTQEANFDSFGIGTTIGSREVCVTVPNTSHATDRSQSILGVVPVPVEYEHIYKEIEDRHGRLDNGQSVGQNDTLSYATLVELLSVVQQLKNLTMESVTEGMLASFERTVTIGKLFNFNVEWLHENLKRLRGHYEKRCAIDVVSLEQDVQRCDTWLEGTQDELSRMEAAYVAAKKKVDDVIKTRDDAKAKLVAARCHLKSSEKFPFAI